MKTINVASRLLYQNKMIGIIATYSNFFKEASPDNKFDLINQIPRSELLSIVSAINNTIKPPIATEFGDSIAVQFQIVDLIFRSDTGKGNKHYANIFKKVFIDYNQEIINENKGGGCLLFTRVSCLYATNQILQSEEISIETDSSRKYTADDLVRVFKFLLLLNDEWLEYTNVYEEEITLEKYPEKFFEIHMFLEIPYQQYYYLQNPINLIYRAIKLFDYIDGDFGDKLNEFLEGFQISSPYDYIGILTLFYFSKGVVPQLQAYVVKKSDNERIMQLNRLSFTQEEVNFDEERPNDYLQIKKKPVYRVEQEHSNLYIVLDNTFFIEKCYDLFFWEFYFEKLKSDGINLERWGGFMGYFFEKHIDNIFTYALKGKRDFTYKGPKSLTLKGKEYADFYIRRKRRVLLIQAKRSYLPYNDYKEVRSIDDFERINKEEFYSRFGLNQLIDTSIKNFNDYAPLVDKHLPKNRLFIYPILIVNEPIIATPITIFSFNKRFDTMCDERGIKRQTRKHIINRLVIIHISELERLQQSLFDDDVRFDSFLQGYVNSTDIHLNKNLFAGFNTFDQYIKANIKGKAIPDYIHDKEGELYEIMNSFIKSEQNGEQTGKTS